jgi:hypothetical protein
MGRAARAKRAERAGGQVLTEIIAAAHAAVGLADVATELSLRCIDATRGRPLSDQEALDADRQLAALRVAVDEARQHVQRWRELLIAGR